MTITTKDTPDLHLHKPRYQPLLSSVICSPSHNLHPEKPKLPHSFALSFVHNTWPFSKMVQKLSSPATSLGFHSVGGISRVHTR